MGCSNYQKMKDLRELIDMVDALKNEETKAPEEQNQLMLHYYNLWIDRLTLKVYGT
jgi:hypothetical protein